MKRKFLILTSTTFFLVSISLPSQALPIGGGGGSSFNFSSLISPFMDLLKDKFGEMKNEFSEQMSQWLGGTGGQIGLEITMGEMGMPDLDALQKEIEEAFNQTEGNQVQADEASNDAVREITRTKADGTLSSEGQEAVKERLETAQTTAQEIDQQAQDIQSETVTQNVLKKMSLQTAKQAVILGSLNTELTDLSTKQDLANQNLTNISEAVDSQNLADQANMTGAANSLLHLSGMLTLR